MHAKLKTTMQISLTEKKPENYDLYAQFGIVSSNEAIKDSGIDVEKIDLDRTVLFGHLVLVV